MTTVPKGSTLSRAQDVSGGFDSMREAYDQLGSDGYYDSHGSDYRNPHETILIEAICLGLTALEDAGLIDARRRLRLLDFGCGSGEGHLAIDEWTAERGRPERQRVDVQACDPYTHAAYEQRMGQPCERWSFEDVAGGVLEEQPPYDVVIAAFCLHLCRPSYLKLTMTALARSSDVLVLASPHKRPHITPELGWEEATPAVLHNRIHVRCFVSNQRPRPEAAVMAAAAERAAAAKAAAAEAAEAEVAATAEAAESGAEVDADEAEQLRLDAEEERAEAIRAAAAVEAAEEAEEAEAEIAEIAAQVAIMNVGALRAALEERGLDTAGKKAVLAERLRIARVREEVDDEDGDEAAVAAAAATPVAEGAGEHSRLDARLRGVLTGFEASVGSALADADVCTLADAKDLSVDDLEELGFSVGERTRLLEAIGAAEAAHPPSPGVKPRAAAAKKSSAPCRDAHGASRASREAAATAAAEAQKAKEAARLTREAALAKAEASLLLGGLAADLDESEVEEAHLPASSRKSKAKGKAKKAGGVYGEAGEDQRHEAAAEEEELAYDRPLTKKEKEKRKKERLREERRVANALDAVALE